MQSLTAEERELLGLGPDVELPLSALGAAPKETHESERVVPEETQQSEAPSTTSDVKSSLIALFQESDFAQKGTISKGKLKKLLIMLGFNEADIDSALLKAPFGFGSSISFEDLIDHLFSSDELPATETVFQMQPRCFGGHLLVNCGLTSDAEFGSGWACHGRYFSGGCKSGLTERGHIDGLLRWKCEECEYDLCGECYHSFTHEATIDGYWNKAAIIGRKLTFHTGKSLLVDRTSPTTLRMDWDGEKYIGELQSDGRLRWSDGDVWTKDHSEIPTGWQCVWAEDSGSYYYLSRSQDRCVWTRAEINDESVETVD